MTPCWVCRATDTPTVQVQMLAWQWPNPFRRVWRAVCAPGAGCQTPPKPSPRHAAGRPRPSRIEDVSLP
jgi:hypothetical protein